MSEPEYAAPTPGFLVWRLSTKWRTAVDRAVGPLGLTHAQYSLISSLLAMHERGLKPSQRELADQTGLEPLSMVTIRLPAAVARGVSQAGCRRRPCARCRLRKVRCRNRILCLSG